jgi:hypothetical protein
MCHASGGGGAGGSGNKGGFDILGVGNGGFDILGFGGHATSFVANCRRGGGGGVSSVIGCRHGGRGGGPFDVVFINFQGAIGGDGGAGGGGGGASCAPRSRSTCCAHRRKLRFKRELNDDPAQMTLPVATSRFRGRLSGTSGSRSYFRLASRGRDKLAEDELCAPKVSSHI